MNVEKIIRSAGFSLVRQRKHRVYYHAGLNKTLVTASTPSDRNAVHHTVAQLARLMGTTKRELLQRTLRRKRRARPVHPTIAPVAVTQPQVVTTPVAPTAPVARLTRAQRNLLKQWEKHEAHKRIKLQKQRERLQFVVNNAHDMFTSAIQDLVPDTDAVEEVHHNIALGLFLAVRTIGYHDAEVMVSECLIQTAIQYLMVVRAGRWYLDYVGGTVNDRPNWKMFSYAEVEVFGTLRVYNEGETFWIAED